MIQSESYAVQGRHYAIMHIDYTQHSLHSHFNEHISIQTLNCIQKLGKQYYKCAPQTPLYNTVNKKNITLWSIQPDSQFQKNTHECNTHMHTYTCIHACAHTHSLHTSFRGWGVGWGGGQGREKVGEKETALV